MANTEEYIEGKLSGELGEVLIRCNNVLYIRGVPESERCELTPLSSRLLVACERGRGP